MNGYLTFAAKFSSFYAAYAAACLAAFGQGAAALIAFPFGEKSWQAAALLAPWAQSFGPAAFYAAANLAAFFLAGLAVKFWFDLRADRGA